MALVWEHAPYSAGSLLTLLALADWANDSGVAWPSIQKLADKARIGKRSAQYIIRQLQKDGYIEIEEGGGRNKQHKFQIKVQKLHPLETMQISQGAKSDMERVQSTTERMQFEAETVQPVAPDPLEEPLVRDPSKKKPSVKRTRKPRAVKPEKTRDARIDHPAMVAFRDVRGRFPNKDVWDLIIITLGTEPDKVKMKECWLAWRSHNYNPQDLAWLVDWYVNGIPQRRFNGNGQSKFDYAERNAERLRQNLDLVSELRGEAGRDHH